MLSPTYLTRKLTSSIPTKDGGTLSTIGEACEYMAAIGKEREIRPHWQRVRELMLQEADVAALPTDFGKLIADDTEKWSKVIKFSGAKPERSSLLDIFHTSRSANLGELRYVPARRAGVTKIICGTVQQIPREVRTQAGPSPAQMCSSGAAREHIRAVALLSSRETEHLCYWAVCSTRRSRLAQR